MDGRIRQMIAERRAQGLARPDLLTRLLAARDEENGGAAVMTDQQVRDEATTLFVAGHETTATSLSWAFYLLGRHPAVREAVQREVDALPPGPVTFAGAASSLPLTTRVFKEAMRLYPPVPIYARRLLVDAEIRGVAMPRGTLVIVTPYPLHRLPDVYPDPERFDPDRFLPAAVEARPRYAVHPLRRGPAGVHRPPLRDARRAHRDGDHHAARAHRDRPRPGDRAEALGDGAPRRRRPRDGLPARGGVVA
ncbi:MAG: cytochrome P450 [Deltaproteobacteria bacterium]|nr:cytochrome P450 [Deltaproteobacteria bacterium]